MLLCRASRAINRRFRGEDAMLCATAFREDWRIRHVFDLVCFFYDGPDHSLRMASFEDTRGWSGAPSRVDAIRRAGW